MNSSEVWDEEKILKVKKILFNKWQKTCFQLQKIPPSPGYLGPIQSVQQVNIKPTSNHIEWKNWLSENNIKSYKELWTCVQFLDNDHIMVDISPKIPFQPIVGGTDDKYKTFLIVPKDFANKLIVLSTFED